jgi:hypothetical protein
MQEREGVFQNHNALVTTLCPRSAWVGLVRVGEKFWTLSNIGTMFEVPVSHAPM